MAIMIPKSPIQGAAQDAYRTAFSAMGKAPTYNPATENVGRLNTRIGYLQRRRPNDPEIQILQNRLANANAYSAAKPVDPTAPGAVTAPNTMDAITPEQAAAAKAAIGMLPKGGAAPQPGGWDNGVLHTMTGQGLSSGMMDAMNSYLANNSSVGNQGSWYGQALSQMPDYSMNWRRPDLNIGQPIANGIKKGINLRIPKVRR